MEKNEKGLSRENQNLIVILVFGLLLVFGPIEPYGLVVRLGYLIVIPVLLWLVLQGLAHKWKIDSLSNDRLTRAIAGEIAGALLIAAYLSYTASYHIQCDQYAQTSDGQDCVGDYRTVKGPDMEGALVEVILAGIAIWYAVSKRTEKRDMNESPKQPEKLSEQEKLRRRTQLQLQARKTTEALVAGLNRAVLEEKRQEELKRNRNY